MVPASVRPEWVFEVANRAQALVLTSLTFDSIVDLCTQHHLPLPASPAEEQILLRFFRGLDGGGADGRTPPEQLEKRENVLPPSPRDDRVRNIVERARELLDAECAHHWTLASLSRRVGCNRTDLETGFRRRFGHTVHVQLDALRIDAAKGLLRETNWRVLEVGRAVGYQSKTSFYRAFSAFIGMTPEAYRARWRLVSANKHVAELLDQDRHCQI